ncbi:MAG: poly(ethylene terephthalate) hydrolase family protein, partial [Bacteroidales bacterium]
ARSRTIQTEVYYPATSAGDNKPFANGQFPVLVFGHGFVMAWDSYQWLWDSLVPRGYIMVFPRTEGGMSPSHSAFGEDLKFLNNFILSEGNNPLSDFYQHILGTSSIMGHSMGGGSSFLASANNTNLTTLINFAAAETNPSAIAAAANVSVPALVFYGLNDGVSPPANNQIQMYNALASTCKTRIGIIGGGHCYFADYNFNCSLGEATTNPQPTITREQQHQIISQLLFPYLDFMLKGNTVAEQIYYQRLNSLNTIVFERNCLMSNDIFLTRFINPINGCGLNSQQMVSVVVKNNGTNPASNIPLTLVLNGQTVASEVYTDTIAPGDSIIFTFTNTVNAGQSGASYQFQVYSTYPNDEYIYNDTLNASFVNTNVDLPLSVNFTNFNGTNLSTVFPGWKEAQGIVPSGTSSLWVNRNGVGGSSNTTAKVNFYSSPIREWILGPSFICNQYTKLSFDVAITEYNSTAPYTDGMANGDSLRIFYSLDCGSTWNRLTAFGKDQNFTNALQTIEIPLGQFNNQGVAIAFQAFRQTTFANDYDLHLDNILIKNYYPYDLKAIEIIKPLEQNCYGTEPIEVTILNNGINAIDFSQDLASVQISVSGPNSFNQTINLNGILNPQQQDTISIGSIDMSQQGTYVFTMKIIYSNDDDTTNNTIVRTIDVNNPGVNISGNLTICNGGSTNLTANASAPGNIIYSESSTQTVNIPDNIGTGVTSIINISGLSSSLLAGSSLKQVIIDSLVHTYVGDLKIDLIAPDNSTINLIYKRGGNGDNFIGTVLDPTASVNIADIVNTNAPFTGTYIPEESFNLLTGGVNGNWQLKIADLGIGDVGILYKWTIILESNNYIVSYTWSTNETTPSITVSPSQTTNYTVTVVDAKGCSSEANATVNVVGSTTNLNLGPDVELCQGDSIILDAGNGFTSYNWNTGDTTQSITVTTSGSFSVTVTDSYGCQNADSVLIVFNNPTPNLGNDTSICQNQQLILTPGNYQQYIWSNGQTSSSITIDANNINPGTFSYSVTVSDQNGCTGTDSIAITIEVCNSINELNASQIAVYPNPAFDNINIEISQSQPISIYTIDGRCLYESLNPKSHHTINVRLWNNGIYYIKIGNEPLQTFKFVKL